MRRAWRMKPLILLVRHQPDPIHADEGLVAQ